MGLFSWFKRNDKGTSLGKEQTAVQAILDNQFLLFTLDVQDSAKAGGFSKHMAIDDLGYITGTKHTYNISDVLGAINRALVLILEAKSARVFKRADFNVLEVNLRRLKEILPPALDS
ncbi:MAG TPA: hypothetical protein VJC07_04675 [Candidatus Nanoarchaeia archaeon]|nr:hypothetical protein [Candidatus Nanoarchaeia archaeon]